MLRNPRVSPEATLVLVYSVINDGVTRDERVAATESSMKLEETKLGEAKRGQKETGNRVWENGWCVLVSVWRRFFFASFATYRTKRLRFSVFGFRLRGRKQSKVSAHSPYGSRSRCAIDVPTR